VLIEPVNPNENECPIITHIMASDLTPFSTLRLLLGLFLNILKVYCKLNMASLFLFFFNVAKITSNKVEIVRIIVR
jgi:hypothetical protein